MRKIIALLILLVPTYGLMLKTGIYTMHDFHVFRQQQFNQSVSALSLPARWAPDSSMGFGQPLFNFYGQTPYWLGSLFGIFGQGVLFSLKSVFVFSLIASALAMYFFASGEFGKKTGLLTALVYAWLPYRAVDVWVRGALNEAVAFVLYPLILWAAVHFVRTRKFVYAGWTSLLLALLLSTHNISFLMFIPFLGIVVIRELFKNFNWHTILDFISIFLATILLSAFYLFPVIAESRFITIGSTTKGYYEYQLHWTTLKQLFFSNFWGYGGSVWGGDDGLSFAVGYVAWIPIVFLGVYILLKKLKSPITVHYLLFTTCATIAVFLTHGKSEVIWRLFPFLAFVQFPWRFLSMAVFWGALAAGLWAKILPKWALAGFMTTIVLLGLHMFKPDIWKTVTDEQYFSGGSWAEQRKSALTDFWPVSAKFIPQAFAFDYPEFLYGIGHATQVVKNGPNAGFTAKITSDIAKVRLPIVYFPGWKIISSQNAKMQIDKKTGLINVLLQKGDVAVQLKFSDTRPRTVGNMVSLVSVVILIYTMKRYAG